MVAVLTARGIAPDEGQRAQIILACRDAAELERWLIRATTASSATDLFAP